MIVEFLLLAGPSIVVCAVYLVVLKGKRKPETTSRQKERDNLPGSSQPRYIPNESPKGLRLRENPNPKRNSVDKQIEELRKLILETTEKVKNMKNTKMKKFKELSFPKKLKFLLMIEPIALVTFQFWCSACFLKRWCPLHEKVKNIKIQK